MAQILLRARTEQGAVALVALLVWLPEGGWIGWTGWLAGWLYDVPSLRSAEG